MNVPKNIKRFWMWVGIALLVELAAFTLWKRWYWFFPTHAVSEVYTRYAGTDGLNVVFFKDFQVNDAVFVNVTLLQSIDSTSWSTLSNDFNIPKLDSEMQQLINDGYDMVFTRQVSKHDYSHVVKGYSPDVELLAISYLMKSICVFHVKNEDEIHAVLYYNLDNSTKK